MRCPLSTQNYWLSIRKQPLGGRRNKIDLTATDAASNEYMMPPPLPHPNITAGIGSYYMDLIKEEEQKSEGQKQKFIKLKSEVKTREEKVEHFKKLTKVSSSVLATNNHCVLDQMILIRCRKRMKWMRQLNR
jgi:hypothetical protein